ncbi:MAG: ribose-phosphate pyrophosphokinase [Alphaproteobacteria bacterium]|nr:ribose-phosphate pyrophosphokinase [Alphaproteobacteria bacterium]
MVIVHDRSTAEFARLLAGELSSTAVCIEYTQFPNSEFRITPVVVSHPPALLIAPQLSNINELLALLILEIGNITSKILDVFIPYIPYSRQDSSASFATVVSILRHLNVRKIITIDVHKETPGIINILPHELFGEEFREEGCVVAAPDAGAIPRARAFATYLGTELITIDKKSGTTENIQAARGKRCLIVDDIVDTGDTIRNADAILQTAGAKKILQCISDTARRNLAKFYKPIARKIAEIAAYEGA